MGGESSEMLPFDIFVYTDTQQLAYFLLFTLYSGAEERTTFKVIDPVFLVGSSIYFSCLIHGYGS